MCTVACSWHLIDRPQSLATALSSSSLVIFKGLCSLSRRWTLICVPDMRWGEPSGLYFIQQVNMISGLVVVPGSDPMRLSGLQVQAGYSIQGWTVEQRQIYQRCPLVGMFEESSYDFYVCVWCCGWRTSRGGGGGGIATRPFRIWYTIVSLPAVHLSDKLDHSSYLIISVTLLHLL